MSIASVFMQQITSNKPASHKMGLIEELFNWKDDQTPLCNMGVLLDGEVKVQYLEEIREYVKEVVSSKKCSIENLFWMHYLAEVLEFKLPEAGSEEERTSEKIWNQYLSEPSKDIEEFVSTIKQT